MTCVRKIIRISWLGPVLKRSFSSTATISNTNKKRWSYIHNPGTVPLINQTIGQMLDECADKHSDVTGIISVHQNVRKTFSEIRKEVDQLASGFISIGLNPGERIGIWGPNSYEWYLTQLAAAKTGLILVSINPAYQADEIDFCLKLVDAKALVSADVFRTQDYYKMLSIVMPEMISAQPGNIQSENIPSLKDIIMISEQQFSGTYNFKDISQGGSKEDNEKLVQLNEEIQADEPNCIHFTSGTTGKPKGTTLSHHNIVNNSRTIADRFCYGDYHHSICLGVPLFHVFGCIGGTTTALVHGSTLVLPSPSYDGLENLKAIEKEKCTILYGTPMMYVDMLGHQSKNKLDLSSLRSAFFGAAPFPPELCIRCVNELDIKTFVVGYGMTETSPVTLFSYLADSLEDKTTSMGYPADNCELKIVDGKGKVLPRGEVGELWVRGYMTMLGYWKDEMKTKETIGKDRWLKTGDLAKMKDNGYVQITGRIKDMIIRGGENIFPAEVEQAIFKHPEVAEVHVCGVPDPKYGEELCAWIRKRDQNSKVNDDDIRKFLKTSVAFFKIPRYILFVDKYPTTGSGKVQKFKMTDESKILLKL